jgi:hypothetical protein
LTQLRAERRKARTVDAVHAQDETVGAFLQFEPVAVATRHDGEETVDAFAPSSLPPP